MTFFRSTNPFMHRIRARQKRFCGLLLVACWLLLNTQLAIASYQCMPVNGGSENVSAMPAMAMSMDMGADMDKAMAHGQASPQLCEKHCSPDASLHDGSGPVALALPSETLLTLAIPVTHTPTARPEWHSPPIAGPPAEIAFCRQRE